MKDFLKIIRDFKKLSYRSYERSRPKHEPTESYFYPERQLAKFMMRSDALNSHVYPVITKIIDIKNSNLARLFYRRKRIKRVPSAQKVIAGLFYG